MSPDLTTERLVLRQVEQRDVAAFVPLIGDYEVAKNPTVVPHIPMARRTGTARRSRWYSARRTGRATTTP